MTMVPVSAANDLVFTYEYDFQPTIMALAYWGGLQGDFHILFNPTITELVDGDVLKCTVVGAANRSTLEAFINGVSQGTGLDTAGQVPINGNPGVGLDNDTGVYGFKGFSAFAPSPDDYSDIAKPVLGRQFSGSLASSRIRRNPARPWNGLLSSKLRMWIKSHPRHRVTTGLSVFPECDTVRWLGHEQTSWNAADERLLRRVRRLPNDASHSRVSAALARGLDPSKCGQCMNMAGHPQLVAPGEHLVMYPEGLVHHGVQDISPYYETVNVLEPRIFTHVPKRSPAYQGVQA